jgi:hypothetical protein
VIEKKIHRSHAWIHVYRLVFHGHVSRLPGGEKITACRGNGDCKGASRATGGAPLVLRAQQPTPATTWADAADKARYLLSLYASSPAAQDPRRQMLIARVLEDFVRLSSPEAD